MAAIEALREFIISEWRWLLLYIMLGFVMYWTALVIDPTFKLLEQAEEERRFALQQNAQIINNTNRNAEYLATYVNESIANQDENLYLLANILNQSNIIGNQTADLILESINKTTELNQNITIKNDVQRADIVEDITVLLEHIDKQLDGLAEQHRNLTEGQGKLENETGKISGFLGGPLITNDSLDVLTAGIISKAQNRS